MRKKLIWALVAVAVIVLGGTSASQAGGPGVHLGVNIGIGHPHGGHVYWRGGYWRPWIWRGPSIWWAPPYYYYAPQPTIVQQPPVYVQPPPQPEEPYYWYYCQKTQAYYPYIRECPEGWMKVVPPTTPPGQ